MALIKQYTDFLQKISFVTIFDASIQFLLIFLPFSSFISVFLTHKLGIPGASFIKEGAIFVALLALIIVYIQSYLGNKKYILGIGYLDYLIVFYFIIMVGVSFFTTGMRGIVFGGRYDFSFLIIFLIAYHGYPLLRNPISYYVKLFLFSAGTMLLLSGLLKWPLREELLLYFGYSGNPSAWDFGGAPPIFHGIDGANVRRFQGLLDGPNSMGAFLIIFSGIFAYFTRFRKDWYFVIAIILMGLFAMVFYTYSRSALISIVVAYTIVLVMSLRSLWNLYRSQLISVFAILALMVSSLGVLYYDRAVAIVGREGSTQGHAERMTVGINRVIDQPLGQGLGSAGPAYRHTIHPDNSTPIVELDRFYIPESWYIQQFIEGGIIGGITFLVIMASLFFLLMMVHPILGALFAGVGIMNLFLHTFESSTVSLVLFLLVGMFLAYKKNARK